MVPVTFPLAPSETSSAQTTQLTINPLAMVNGMKGGMDIISFFWGKIFFLIVIHGFEERIFIAEFERDGSG